MRKQGVCTRRTLVCGSEFQTVNVLSLSENRATRKAPCKRERSEEGEEESGVRSEVERLSMQEAQEEHTVDREGLDTEGGEIEREEVEKWGEERRRIANEYLSAGPLVAPLHTQLEYIGKHTQEEVRHTHYTTPEERRAKGGRRHRHTSRRVCVCARVLVHTFVNAFTSIPRETRNETHCVLPASAARWSAVKPTTQPDNTSDKTTQATQILRYATGTKDEQPSMKNVTLHQRLGRTQHVNGVFLYNPITLEAAWQTSCLHPNCGTYQHPRWIHRNRKWL